jgi:serine/threonine-protein kinase
MQSAMHLDGRVIGERYRVVRELGGGGMGTVYEVEHVDLGRPFALKVLRLGTRNDELEQRFRREARALAMVRSARVAQVTDFGIDPVVGTWYVMELVAGESLETRLQRETSLAPADALPILADVADAIADVHEAGLVHRDLKPSNVGLPSRGPLRAQLLDFGLAASVDDAFLTRITQSQQVLGSLPYIAPESFSGARPSPAADVWSLGIVIYETLAGRLPFDAPSTAALMHAILTAPVPRLEGFPPALASLLRAMMEKEPEHRTIGAREVAERLRAASRASLPPTIFTSEPAPPPRTRAMSSAEWTPPGAHTQPISTPDVAGPHVPTSAPIESSIRVSAAASARSAVPRWLPWLGLGLLAAIGSAVGAMVALDAWADEPASATASTPSTANVGASSPSATSVGTTSAGTTNAGATNAGATNAGATNAGATNAGATNAGATSVGATSAGTTNAGTTNVPSSVEAPTSPTDEATPTRRSRESIRTERRDHGSRTEPGTTRDEPDDENPTASGWRGGIIEDLE